MRLSRIPLLAARMCWTKELQGKIFVKSIFQGRLRAHRMDCMILSVFCGARLRRLHQRGSTRRVGDPSRFGFSTGGHKRQDYLSNQHLHLSDGLELVHQVRFHLKAEPAFLIPPDLQSFTKK
jgi:hypothetical protein